MSIKGYARGVGKRSGGISSIALADAAGVESTGYDFATDRFSDIVFRDGSRFTSYDFKEGEAEYTEQVVADGGIARVTHKLVFSLERMDGESRRAVEELAAARGGVVAVVTTSNGVSLLVGYSRRFGCERALRLSRGEGGSGRLFGDDTFETVTLLSEDASKAKTFCGAQGGLP